MATHLEVGDQVQRKSDKRFFTVCQIKEDSYHFEPDHDMNWQVFGVNGGVSGTWCKKRRFDYGFEKVDNEAPTIEVESASSQLEDFGSW